MIELECLLCEKKYKASRLNVPQICPYCRDKISKYRLDPRFIMLTNLLEWMKKENLRLAHINSNTIYSRKKTKETILEHYWEGRHWENE